MINYPIETDVKIHVIWYEEDWTSNHSVWDDYLTQDCDTYTLKNVNNWKDLFIKVIQYYKKNRYTIDYCDGHNDKLILCGIIENRNHCETKINIKASISVIL